MKSERLERSIYDMFFIYCMHGKRITTHSTTHRKSVVLPNIHLLECKSIDVLTASEM